MYKLNVSAIMAIALDCINECTWICFKIYIYLSIQQHSYCSLKTAWQHNADEERAIDTAQEWTKGTIMHVMLHLSHMIA